MLDVLPERKSGDYIVTMNLQTRYLQDKRNEQAEKK